MAAKIRIAGFVINALAFAVFLLFAIAGVPDIGVAVGWFVLYCCWLNRQPERPDFERPTLRMVLTVALVMILAALVVSPFLLNLRQKP